MANHDTTAPSDSTTVDGSADTDRLTQVAGMIAAGTTTPQIAAGLGVSERSVHRYRKRLRELGREPAGQHADRVLEQAEAHKRRPQVQAAPANGAASEPADSREAERPDGIEEIQGPDRTPEQVAHTEPTPPTCGYCGQAGRVGYGHGDLVPAQIRDRRYTVHARCFDRLVERLREAAA